MDDQKDKSGKLPNEAEKRDDTPEQSMEQAQAEAAEERKKEGGYQ